MTPYIPRHLGGDPAIASADSTASPDHPMIDAIWRGRFAIGDVSIPLRRNDPVAALTGAAIATRSLARDLARGALHYLRGR